MPTPETPQRVVDVTPDQMIWRFGEDLPVMPTGRRYARTKVDPFPAYAHDTALVEDALDCVESTVEIHHKPSVYVLHRECTSRTNGWAEVDHRYYDDDCAKPCCADKTVKWDGIIVLAGKRIPPHPAMTRYLVAHEYGHHVEYELLHRRGLDPGDSVVRDEYARMRGCPNVNYGGGTWHKSPGELLANDFRIVVAGVEPEFWPHPGFTHPLEDALVQRWWAENLSSAG